MFLGVRSSHRIKKGALKMPKRGLNIHKRKDGRWEGRHEAGRKPNGKIMYRSVYGKTYAEVKEKMKNMAANVLPSMSLPKTGKTFGDAASMWVQNSQIKNKGGTTNKYQNLIDSHILPYWSDIKLSEINSFMINSFLKEKLENGRLNGKGGLSPSYVRSIMIVMNSVINYAIAEKMCEPLRSPILKPAIIKKEIEVLSLENQRRLEETISTPDDPTELGILISLYTGLRIGEICALAWNDIDYHKGTLKVNHTVARVKSPDCRSSSILIIDTPKTKASIREIPIPLRLTDALKRTHEISLSPYVVSTSESFVSPRTYDYRYHKIITSAGIPNVNYHTLRHTFATRCIEAGVDIKSLSEILGHANVAITLNTYVHSSIDTKRLQLEKLYSLV